MVAHAEFSKSVRDGPAVKARNDPAPIGVDVVDVADNYSCRTSLFIAGRVLGFYAVRKPMLKL
jgi:hypothetical protein